MSEYEPSMHTKCSKESRVGCISLRIFFFLPRTLALIKPDGMRKIGELFDIIINAGLTITKAKMMLLSR